jgi:hypothetical protein
MGHKLTLEKSLEFILGGRAIFTALNTETGNRFTFKVNKGKKDIYFVNVLTGPNIFEFIGTFTSNTNFKVGQKSRISEQSTSYKVFYYILNHLRKGDLLPQVEIWHEGKCAKCGRSLTDPESIKTGWGPYCRKINK